MGKVGTRMTRHSVARTCRYFCSLTDAAMGTRREGSGRDTGGTERNDDGEISMSCISAYKRARTAPATRNSMNLPLCIRPTIFEPHPSLLAETARDRRLSDPSREAETPVRDLDGFH